MLNDSACSIMLSSAAYPLSFWASSICTQGEHGLKCAEEEQQQAKGVSEQPQFG